MMRMLQREMNTLMTMITLPHPPRKLPFLCHCVNSGKSAGQTARLFWREEVGVRVKVRVRVGVVVGVGVGVGVVVE